MESKFLTWLNYPRDLMPLHKWEPGVETLVLKPEKLDVEYDGKNDVLYVSVGKPKAADDSIEPQDGVVMRTRKGELVGITILRLRGRHETSARNRRTKRGEP